LSILSRFLEASLLCVSTQKAFEILFTHTTGGIVLELTSDLKLSKELLAFSQISTTAEDNQNEKNTTFVV